MRHVAIIGRGIAGLSLAYELQKIGQKVVLIGPRTDPMMATQAAVGVSVTKGKSDPRQPLFAAKLAGHAHLKEYLPRIERETGMRIRRLVGSVYEPFHDDERFEKIRSRVFKDAPPLQTRAQAGIGLDRLVQSGVAAVIDTASMRGAFHYPGDLWFDPRDLLEALTVGVTSLGGTFLDRRVESAEDLTAILGTSRATDVVLAMGAGAGPLLQALQLDHLVLDPVAGATLEGETHNQSTGGAAGGRGAVVLDGTMNFVSYEDRTLFGSTSERGTEVSLTSIAQLETRLRFFARGVDSVSVRTGVRARFFDRMPAVGPVACPLFEGGTWVSLGYYKSGLQLAPLFCADLAQWIASGSPVPTLFPFAATRFSR